MDSAECRYCGRRIIERDGRWIDPEATGDDAVWRETCDSHDTFTAEHEPKVVNESAQSEGLNPAELGNTYLSERDRFVVSLIVGYAEEDGPKYPNQAASAALDLTRDGGSSDTHWYVFDRKTGVMHMLEQGEFEGLPFEEDE